jgi:hypothetical protein
MVHPEIEKAETIERYIQNQLTLAERQEFEEHFLTCDDCFEKLQTAERFAVGMRDAAERGLLDARPQLQGVNPGWFVWAFAASACTALIFAGLAGWVYFGQVPHLQRELRQTAAKLEKQSQSQTEQAVRTEEAEANVPLVMLQASRAEGEVPNLILKPNDNRLVLWIEPGPSRYRDFRLEIFSSDNKLVTSVDHLMLGRYGALAASLPTKQLPSGDFRITLTGQDPPPAALAGEYHLEIRRR